MGAGATKLHEPFAVAPSVTLEAPGVLIPERQAPPSDPGGNDRRALREGPAPGRAAGAAREALTPVPDTVEPGLISGVPLLVGGVDLVDSLATLVAYQGPDQPREVLHATVAEEAEAKLLEALWISEDKLVPVAVEKEVHGRLPIDERHQLYEELVTVVKSVNHHLKQGDGIPQHTRDRYEKLQAKLTELAADPATTPDEQEMLAAYQSACAAVGERLAPGFAVPYAQGGKVPKVEPYHVAKSVTVTESVPAPAEDPPAGLLPARLRDATRIRPTIEDGVARWDGRARSKAAGKEYAVDLGDGYTAVYRPYAGGKDAPEFSHRGSLEVIAPPGAGHGPELVTRLGRLNLVNRPLTREEGEWAYLVRNIWAQQLDRTKEVARALEEAAGLEDALQEVLVAERKHEAVGLDEKRLLAFAKEIRLEAEARALPEKVRLVRDAVARAAGFPSGEALAASPGYDPTPKARGGWLVWERFDVAKGPDEVNAAFGKKGLVHRLTGRNLLDVLRNGGVLASTERRRLMGVGSGKGMSEGADMQTGGARSVFLRVGSRPSHGPALFWEDPARLLRRADWYAYPTDHFGSLNPQSSHSTSGQTRDPLAVAGFNGGSNEVMFRDGIDLLGEEAPTRVLCSSSSERQQILALLAERGITELAGRPVGEVVQ